MHFSHNKQSAFTIVELLIVVVVIGVLAAMVFVSYVGISKNAALASLKIDLSNSSRKMDLYLTSNDSYPVAIDCTSTPAANTICIKNSTGNSVTDYEVDNSAGRQSYCLAYSDSNGSVYKIINGSNPTVGNCSRTSCLDIYSNNESYGNGNYWIKPTANYYHVYCDMTNGGWTRLNNTVATSTVAYNSNDEIVTNNVPGNCGAPGCAFTVNNILINHTDAAVEYTRSTSIVQCPKIASTSTVSSYWNGTVWVGRGTCTWGDGLFANACCDPINMIGLENYNRWKIVGPKAISGEIKFTSECSAPSDNGITRFITWVK